MHLVLGIVASNLKPARLAELYAKRRIEKIRHERHTRRPNTTLSKKGALRATLGPTTVPRIRQLMHRKLGWAEREEIVVRNVARKEMEVAPKAAPSPAPR